MRKSSSKVKLKDIAKASGVAVTTVSAALNRTGRVSDELRQKILKVSREMNYEPNIAAQLLKQKNCNDIGLIVSDDPGRIVGSGYFQPMIAYFIQFCDSQGIRCQIEYHYPKEQADKLPSLLTSGFAGGVLHGGSISDDIRSWLKSNPDFPFVAFEDDCKYSIHSLYQTAAYEAIQAFAAFGHRKIGLVVGPQEYEMQRKLLAGTTKAVQDFGSDTSNGAWIYESKMGLDQETVRDAIDYGVKIFSQSHRPTAMLCCDARVAKGIIYAAMSCGLKVPDDLSIIGASSKSESEQMYPALSSVSWNAPEAIQNGYHVLTTLMNGGKLLNKKIEIKPLITMRDSVARCKY